MKHNYLAWLLLGILSWTPVSRLSAAEQPPSVEAQLRERLRASLIQLRTAESERAALQAAQTQWADEKAKLTARNEALAKQLNENKLTAQVVEGLKSQIARQEKEAAQLKEAIENCQQSAVLAHNKDAERVKRAEEAVVDLQRLVVDRQTKNLALYKVGTEILERYQKFSLGDAISAREPFIGITRVKLQNLVQDYQDKLQGERTSLDAKDLEFSPDKQANRTLPK